MVCRPTFVEYMAWRRTCNYMEGWGDSYNVMLGRQLQLCRPYIACNCVLEMKMKNIVYA